eukprot:2834401-Prymnesium_polylepis.2
MSPAEPLEPHRLSCLRLSPEPSWGAWLVTIGSRLTAPLPWYSFRWQVDCFNGIQGWRSGRKRLRGQ